MRWRADGGEIFYVTRDGDLMAAEVALSENTVGIGRGRRLFGGVTGGAGSGYVYDVSLDGQRFLVAAGGETDDAPQSLTLIQNWTELLPKPHPR